MKIVHESIFMNSLRAFFVSLFGALGIIVGLCVLTIAIFAIVYSVEKEGFSSSVKILPDANGKRKELSSSTPIILQITLDGTIGKESVTGEKIQQILLDSRDDNFKPNRVKGILLMINSPGGSVNESDIIYHLLKEYKVLYKVPIYAYVNGLCASGGYYIACVADKIYASDVSLVGSIGVVSWPPFMNITDTMEKIGVNALTLVAGKGKDELNPFRPWKEDEQKNYQTLINTFYHQFVQHVASSRPITSEDLVEKMGAKIYPASQAKELGLIDVADSSRTDVVGDFAKALGLKSYQVVGFESKSWWRKAFKSQSPLITGKLKHELIFSGDKDFPFSYLYKP